MFQLTVWNKDRRLLNFGAFNRSTPLHGDDFDALRLVFQRLELQANSGRTLELDINARYRAMYGDRALLAASLRLTVCLIESRPQSSRMPASIRWSRYFDWRDLARVRRVRLCLRSRRNKKVSTISWRGH